MGTSLFVADSSNPVTPDNFNTYEQTCGDVDTLRGFIGVTGMQVFLRGFASPGDGGQGEFYWNATGTSPDDAGVTTVIPTGSSVGNGEWTRLPITAPTGVQNLTNALNFASGGSIASASTTDIGAATGNNVTITGANTINSFGTVQAGTQREVTFAGALTLTYNATSLILPTGANILTAPGDTSTWLSMGSGNWINISYQRASGQPLAGSASLKTMNMQVFTGSSTYIPTTGMLYAIAFGLGAGGGGGGVALSTTGGTGGGGGAGALSIKLLTAAAVGASQVVTIGGAGAGGVAGNNAGGTGGDTSIGSLLVAKGGSGGAGGPANASGSAGLGGAGGGGTGDVKGSGQSGFLGSSLNTIQTFSGRGGSTMLGSGGSQSAAQTGASQIGQNAAGYGAGGSGGVDYNNANTAGGAGTGGIVFITEFLSV